MVCWVHHIWVSFNRSANLLDYKLTTWHHHWLLWNQLVAWNLVQNVTLAYSVWNQNRVGPLNCLKRKEEVLIGFDFFISWLSVSLNSLMRWTQRNWWKTDIYSFVYQCQCIFHVFLFFLGILSLLSSLNNLFKWYVHLVIMIKMFRLHILDMFSVKVKIFKVRFKTFEIYIENSILNHFDIKQFDCFHFWIFFIENISIAEFSKFIIVKLKTVFKV